MKLLNEEFTVSQQFKGFSKQKSNPSMNCPNFKVTLRKGKNWTSFDFHGSHNDYLQRRGELSENELIFAVYCFLTDAIAGNENLEDFCADFGYDFNGGYYIHKECQKLTAKAERFFDNDLYDLLNDLQEKHPDSI